MPKQVRIPIEKEGSLTKYGYRMRDPPKKRRTALGKAVKRYGYTSVAQKLIALQVLNKTDDPDLSQTAKRDREWLRERHRPSSIRSR
jgi:hypothetical protein